MCVQVQVRCSSTMELACGADTKEHRTPTSQCSPVRHRTMHHPPYESATCPLRHRRPASGSTREANHPGTWRFGVVWWLRAVGVPMVKNRQRRRSVSAYRVVGGAGRTWGGGGGGGSAITVRVQRARYVPPIPVKKIRRPGGLHHLPSSWHPGN